MPGQLARRLGAQVVNGIMPFHLGTPMPYIPLSEVLKLKVNGDVEKLQSLFLGKVVLLGSLLDYDDLHAVPLPLAVGESSDATHGVFILARQLQSLLNGNLIQEIPFNLSLLLMLIATLAWWFRPSRKIYLCAVFGVLSLLGISLHLLASGLAMPLGSMTLSIATGLSARSILFSIQNAAERKHLKSAFGGFVSPDVLTEIMSGRLSANLNGERRTICILFSDIRNFTTLSEKMAPEAVTQFLNSYFELMVACIHQNGGTVDKFMGDGIMAFFGAPRDVANPCEDAFNAAQMMLIQVEKLNQDWEKENNEKFSIGIGLNYGPAYLGYIGSKERHEYSAIGDAVNLTARVEGLTKGSGYPIMVTSSVNDALPQIQGFVDLGMKPVKGRSDARVYGWKL
jgi:class 3 adenylate cyclase